MEEGNHEFDDRATTWDDDPTRRERAAAVARRIREEVPLLPDTRVLDFGSGTGLLGFHFLPDAASVTFADPSAAMLREVERKLGEEGRANGRILRFDPDAPTLPARYDAVVSLLALHHVEDPVATLRFLAAHVEPGGWLALSDLDTEDRTFHDDPDADVHPGFDRDVLVEQLRELGFVRARAVTAHIIRKERPDGIREYPLFLLIGERPS